MRKTIILIIPFALLAIIYGCHHTRPIAAQPPSGGSETLFEYKWILTELNGQPLGTGNRDTAHLLFFPGQVSRVSGSGGCNRLNGTFELSTDHKIKFSPLATTRMACAGNTESQFLTALGQTNNWSIINNQLLLNNGKILVAKLQGVSANQPK